MYTDNLYIYIYRRLGGLLNREILMVPACVILSLGFLLSIVVRCPARALLVWCLTLLRNELKSGFVRSWMIPGGSWMSSGEY